MFGMFWPMLQMASLTVYKSRRMNTVIDCRVIIVEFPLLCDFRQPIHPGPRNTEWPEWPDHSPLSGDRLERAPRKMRTSQTTITKGAGPMESNNNTRPVNKYLWQQFSGIPGHWCLQAILQSLHQTSLAQSTMAPCLDSKSPTMIRQWSR